MMFLGSWLSFKRRAGILDWSTIPVGIAALALHGAAWIALKTEDDLHERALDAASTAWWLVAALTLAITFTSFRLSAFTKALGLRFSGSCRLGLLSVKWFIRARDEIRVLRRLACMSRECWPASRLASFPTSCNGLTAFNAKAADCGLKVGLVWWIAGMTLAAVYTIYTYRNFAGKISTEENEETY